MVRPPKNTSIDISELPSLLAPIFQQAQYTLANHRKNVVALHQIHESAAKVTESAGKGAGVKLTGEAAFNKAFVGMVNLVLPLKRGVVQADKMIKFVASFVRYSSEKAVEEKEKSGSKDDEDDDTPTSRFVTVMVNHLLRGFEAKDKNVRYRVVQCIAEMVSSIGEIDEELYKTLRMSLLERVRDKESAIRVQAVVALAKLQDGEDPEELEDDVQTLTDVLIDVLQHDPAPDVRRAALLNITPSKFTLEALLSRTRDQDNLIRKLLYAHVLSTLPHPKILSISQREEVVKNGLKDREPSVRAAAGKLIGAWIDLLEGGLEELLTMFDLIGSEDVAQEALFSAFITRPDLFDGIEFDDKFWEELTPERAFLARVFVDHCVNAKANEKLETSLPVVTALAFRIQNYYNSLLELARQLEEEPSNSDDEDDRDERRADSELIVAQLLKIAVNVDYSDEIGRRKMYGLVREMIGQEALPESLVARCLDVLRKLSANERDLIRLVVEVVQELRDLTREDEPELPEKAPGDESQFGDDVTEGGRAPALQQPPKEITPETQARMEAIDLRCLSLCIGMLERVNSTLQDNSVLHGLLPELIIPSVRSKDPAIREKGLMSLGLCCLIDKKIALSSFSLFVQQAQVAVDDIKKRSMETAFDLLMVYESEFFKADNRIEMLLLQMLDSENPEVQAIACEGVAKLMLSGMIADDKLLRSLIILYLTPETEDNQALRQCLSYFFPVFCYSNPSNQRKMQHIFLETYWHLRDHRRTLDDDQEMVSPAQITLLFIDWTDPQKAVEVKDQAPDTAVQADLALDIMKSLMLQKFPIDLTKEGHARASINMSNEDRKVLCQMLPKLHIPVDLDDDKAHQLKILASALTIHRPPKDSVAKNAIAKFDKVVSKTLSEQLEALNTEDYEILSNIQERFDWTDDILEDLSDDEDATPPATPPHKARKLPRAKQPRVQAARAAKQKKLEQDRERDIDSMLGSEDGEEEEDGEDETADPSEAAEVDNALSVAGDSDEE